MRNPIQELIDILSDANKLQLDTKIQSEIFDDVITLLNKKYGFTIFICK